MFPSASNEADRTGTTSSWVGSTHSPRDLQLTRWGLLEHDTAIARWMRAIARLVCIASIIAAVWSVLQRPREQTVDVA